MSCAGCRTHPPPFELARSPWLYAGRTRDAVRQFKYHRGWRTGRWLAEQMARFAERVFPLETIELVLPVPRYWLKRRWQGFDHAASLASLVADSLGKPCRADALRQTRWTRSQTRLRGRARLANVRHAFAARAGRVKAGAVLLVDDVFTTGATTRMCSQQLRAAGVGRVYVLTAARARGPMA